MQPLNTSEELEEWLAVQPREIALPIAARAAARSIPALALLLPSRPHRRNTASILAIFRALSVAVTAARFPISGANIRVAAAEAMVESSTAPFGNAVNEAARCAALSRPLEVAQAAIGTVSAAAILLEQLGDDAALTNLNWTSQLRSRRRVTELRKAILEPTIVDVRHIEADSNSNPLMRLPLWSEVGPSISTQAWPYLKQWLINADEDWQVWTDWFDALAAGQSATRELEVARATIPANVWNLGPVGANARIRRLIEQHTKPLAQNPAESGWRQRLAALEQARLGARFKVSGSNLAIDASGDDSDERAAEEKTTIQLHAGLKTRARNLAEMARRIANRIGWGELPVEATRFVAAREGEISTVPDRIGTLYEIIISLGSFLEMDGQLRASASDSLAEPLDEEIRRTLSDLIRTAAPWIRRFPTARKLDDEAGAFLTREELYLTASEVVETARHERVISDADAASIRAVIQAAKRGTFQGQKAGTRGVFSAKNLVVALGWVLAFHIGMIENEAAPESKLAANGARLYLSMEAQILSLFAEAPPDLRHALSAMIDELRKRGETPAARLPYAPVDEGRRPQKDTDEPRRD